MARAHVRDDALSLVIDLESGILSGKLKPGDLIPSEDSLMKKYSISRNKVRDQLKTLKELGLIEGRPGSGTFVCEFPTQTVSDSAYRDFVDPSRSITPEHQEVPGEARAVNRKMDVMSAQQAPAEAATALRLDPDDEVVRLWFLERRFGKAVSLTTSWIPYDVIKDSHVMSDEYVPTSAYPVDALDLAGRVVAYFEFENGPRLPSGMEVDEKHGLGASPHRHVSVLYRHSFDEQDRVIEVGERVSRGLTWYQYRVDLLKPDRAT